VFSGTDILFTTLTLKKSPKTNGIFRLVLKLLVAPAGMTNCVTKLPFFSKLYATGGDGGLPKAEDIACE
jgi:hypothetical protein